MDHCERADAYHKMGYNCCQSVLAAFSDVTGLSEAESLRVGGGFGSGAGTGELCGAISGALMTLGLLTPVDSADPVGSKRRALQKSKEFQKRFQERFGALRCQDLLANPEIREGAAMRAEQLGIHGHCAIMVVTAAEILDEMLAE